MAEVPESSQEARDVREGATQRALRPIRASPRPQRSPNFEHAIDLALQGFAIFPLRPGTKTPLVKDWEQRASTDPHQIARWWTRHPSANIAIACGPSNLLVIDLDTAKRPGQPGHGQHTLTALASGRAIPRTFTVASARGGRHLYFRQPEGDALRNTTGSNYSGLGPLIDTRGHGGYIVAPGSAFASRTYRIEHDAPIAPLPAWIAHELESRQTPAMPTLDADEQSRAPVVEKRRTAYATAVLRRAADSVAAAPEGTRNDALNREAFRLGRLIGGGILDPEDAATSLRRAAHKAGLPPHEIETTLASGLSAGITRPRSIPDRTPKPQSDHATTEDVMTTTTTDAAESTGRSAIAPPRAATLYPHLSAPGSRAFQDALRTLWRLGPTAIGLPETTAAPIRAAWQDAGQQMAAAIRDGESTSPDLDPDEPPAENDPAATPTQDETPNLPALRAAADDSEFEDVWAHIRERVELARPELPALPELHTFDEVQQAITDLRKALAAAPISLSDTTEISKALPPSPKEHHAEPIEARYTQAHDDATDLDQYLATVDGTYADALSATPLTSPEWAGIRTIHDAVHHLWDTIKAATGSYWTEFAADARLHGALGTLATHATRAIAYLANAAATHVEQHTMAHLPAKTPVEPGLREAYINARNHVRTHAASHEWRRITALWGTVNTLTRQADDPGIRAVVARSADAISDYADTLSRRSANGNRNGETDALGALSRAAERHAANLRRSDAAPGKPGTPPPYQHTNAHALQESARQVAHSAQARLGQSSTTTAAAPHRPPSTGAPSNQGAEMRATRPATPKGSITAHMN